MSSFKKNNNVLPKKYRQEKMISDEIINFESFKNLNVSVCIHCANLDIFKELLTYIQNFELFEWNRLQIIINVVIEIVNYDEITSLIKNTFSNNKTHIIIIKSENMGLDIGGFLRCLQYVKEDDHIVAKIHTKTDDKWREAMMKIFTKEGIYNSIKLLHFEKVGMIGNNNQLWDIYKSTITTEANKLSYKEQIFQICQIMKIPFNYIKLHQSYLIGGTIFICKKNILNDIIKFKDKLYQYCNKADYYKNKLAFTFELTMERFFGYIVYHYNKEIVGLIS